jgi:predicted membrane chloride channel (bestrophin family)
MSAVACGLGSVLAFITVFRTNRSYDAYIEGRKLVSSVVSNLRTALMDMVR